MSANQTIQQMRPEAPDLDPEWSARTLQRIVATKRRPRRALKIGLGAAAVVVATGGVAWTAGLVPSHVLEDFDAISTSELHDIHEVASFELDRGASHRHFDVYRAKNEDGEQCWITHEAKGRFGPSSDGACETDPADGWFSWTAESARVDEPMPPATLYVYGERTRPDVVAVRVFGPRFDRTTRVVPATGGWATAVPEVTLANYDEYAGQLVAELQFLDAQGQVLGSKTIRDR